MENTGHSVPLCGLGGNRHLGLQEGVSLVRALGVGMRQTEARATKSNAARHNALSLFIFLILQAVNKFNFHACCDSNLLTTLIGAWGSGDDLCVWGCGDAS